MAKSGKKKTRTRVARPQTSSGPNKYQTMIFCTEKICQFGRSALKYGCYAFGFWCAYLSVKVLAGKETLADFGLEVLASKSVSQIVMALFGISGIGYGVKQKRLYQQASKKLKRLKKYEEQYDPRRTGSGLVEGFRANPEDPQ